jgi:hypothetical protein
MKKNMKLILEYAKLAALELSQGQRTITKRMEEIQDQLQMTKEAILRVATEKALASLR